MKKCKRCKIFLEINSFCKNIRNADQLNHWCKSCVSTYKKQYNFENKSKIQLKNKINYQANKIYIIEKCKIYYENNKKKKKAYDKIRYNKNKEINKQYRKLYYLANKDLCVKRNKINSNKRYNLDINFKIRNRISLTIRKALLLQNSSKDDSIIKYLNYSIEELKNHLEKQFEPWMNWNNWKKYNLNTWNDNDSSTWTWNIDHIIPQSKLHYTSMKDDNFKKCWALSNLRPYSSKQNILDGNR